MCIPFFMRVMITVEDQTVANGGEPLKALCREEVEKFHQYLLKFGGEFKDGLAKFERVAIEGYLYQKIRGHIDG